MNERLIEWVNIYHLTEVSLILLHLTKSTELLSTTMRAKAIVLQSMVISISSTITFQELGIEIMSPTPIMEDTTEVVSQSPRVA